MSPEKGVHFARYVVQGQVNPFRHDVQDLARHRVSLKQHYGFMLNFKRKLDIAYRQCSHFSTSSHGLVEKFTVVSKANFFLSLKMI